MKPGCTLIAYLHGKPEKRAELLEILQNFVKPTRAEAGCVEYHLHVDDNELVEERLRTLALPIAAGASQIQRNIISERLLGMPREPR